VPAERGWKSKGALGGEMEVREGMSEVVLTVGPGHTLRDAARMMTEKRVGAAIVVDEEAPGPGIISERDVLVSIGRGEDPDAERVGAHMSSSVITAAPDWSLERAASDMAARGIRHLVIVEGGEISGVLSMRDIMRVWTSAGATSSMTPG
jgi:CBS domain-containing protein